MSEAEKPKRRCLKVIKAGRATVSEVQPKVEEVTPRPQETPTGTKAEPPIPAGDRLIVQNLEDRFTCDGCQRTYAQWMLYIDVPCTNLCRVCHLCLQSLSHCPLCKRTLSSAELQMVQIYAETFSPSSS